MEPKIVGNRIKELMKIKQIKEIDLAKELNIPIEELKKKLNGEEEFFVSQIMQIKEIFHLNLNTWARLFFEEDFNFEEIFANLY